MTNLNKATLATVFAQGDVPQGSDFSNLIYSQVNLAETAEQDMSGPLYTTKLLTPRVSGTNLNVTTRLSAAAATITGLLSADGGVNTVTVSATTINAGTYRAGAPVIVSALGTAQATAAPISATVGITRLQGVTDGQTTGFLLPSPIGNVGIEQVLMYEGTVSGNLWPNSGCSINLLGSNVVFPLVAKTPYYVTYITTSAYAVK